MNKPRFIIVGYGAMGSWHAERIQGCGFAELSCVYDLDPEKRRMARSRGLRACESMEEAIADNAECAIVATPNDTHCALTCALLRAGKHVIVEKPAAMNSAELRRMYAVAREHDRRLSPHQNRRWDADFCAVRTALQQKLLGEVFNVESRIHGSRGIPSAWRREKARGGGMLYDWGIHLLDQTLLLFEGQAPRSVACTWTHVRENDVDDGFYHAIYITDIEFVKDAFIAGIHRALRPGGRLIIVDNAVTEVGVPPYYGPGIKPELIIAQLSYYGFHLVDRWQEVPQRFALIFQEDENYEPPKVAEPEKKKEKGDRNKNEVNRLLQPLRKRPGKGLPFGRKGHHEGPDDDRRNDY